MRSEREMQHQMVTKNSTRSLRNLQKLKYNSNSYATRMGLCHLQTISKRSMKSTIKSKKRKVRFLFILRYPTNTSSFSKQVEDSRSRVRGVSQSHAK